MRYPLRLTPSAGTTTASISSDGTHSLCNGSDTPQRFLVRTASPSKNRQCMRGSPGFRVSSGASTGSAIRLPCSTRRRMSGRISISARSMSGQYAWMVRALWISGRPHSSSHIAELFCARSSGVSSARLRRNSWRRAAFCCWRIERAPVYRYGESLLLNEGNIVRYRYRP